MALLRAEYEKRRGQWKGAMYDIALKYGKDSWAYYLLGSLAWGRFEKEGNPSERMADVAEGYGYLQGYRDACLRASELAKDPSERDFRTIHQNPRFLR